ncbi:MAG: hypothetical protein IKO98_10220 [Bacteroidales bacterium]|nr:hypothetical protein [Bacteroidales bacterium]
MMNKPKHPCRWNCPDRKAGCHNDRCPHGWADYERAYREWRAQADADWNGWVKADDYRSKRIQKRLHGPDGYRRNAPIAR